MGDLLALLHTELTNWIGGHEKLTFSVLIFMFVVRPAAIAFLKDAFPKVTPPTGAELLKRPAVQEILRKPQTTPWEQAAAIDALIAVIDPPLTRPPLVAGTLAALGIVTNLWRWVLQMLHVTPPTEDVVGSSPDVQLPQKPVPRSSTEGQ